MCSLLPLRDPATFWADSAQETQSYRQLNPPSETKGSDLITVSKGSVCLAKTACSFALPSQSCKHVDSFCSSYEGIAVLSSVCSQKCKKDEMSGFLPFLSPPHQGLHLLLFLLPSLQDTFSPLKVFLFFSLPQTSQESICFP